MGLLTLLLACAFMGWWFKSFSYFCKLSFASGRTSYCEVSSFEGLVKTEVFFNEDLELSRSRFGWKSWGQLKWKGWADVIWYPIKEPRETGALYYYGWGWGEFRFRRGMEGQAGAYRIQVIGLAVPHWGIATLFGLISIPLLFIKLRTKTASSSPLLSKTPK